MFTVYNNLLSKEYFTGLHHRLCGESGWGYQTLSDPSDNSGLRFWYKNLDNDKLFTETLFEKICECTGKKFQLLRVYANGQTYGLSGGLHIDDQRSNAFTFLYYTNPKWYLQWGGATVFSEITDKVKSKLTHPTLSGDISNINYRLFIPIPNTGLLYKSNITHAGLEPTRHCKELRITVSYKLLLE